MKQTSVAKTLRMINETVAAMKQHNIGSLDYHYVEGDKCPVFTMKPLYVLDEKYRHANEALESKIFSDLMGCFPRVSSALIDATGSLTLITEEHGIISTYTARLVKVRPPLKITTQYPDGNMTVVDTYIDTAIANDIATIAHLDKSVRQSTVAVTSSEYTVRISDRSLPLAYTAPLRACPTVTVEIYDKWYSMYVVMTDGEVRKSQSFDEWHEACESVVGVPYVDHVFNPQLAKDFAKLIGGKVCPMSYEMMVGRWETDVKANY